MLNRRASKYIISEKFNSHAANYSTVAEAMDHASFHVVGYILNGIDSCCRAFPDECKGCSEYVETYPLDLGLAGYFGLYFSPSYIIKKCKRFNWKSCEEIRR